MKINYADYIGSFPKVNLCPKDFKPEYAFIGRSNVGKSSLINALCGRKALARTSNKPGKTQMLNYYLIDNSWYIVDLPGYGYAKISKTKRKEWEKMIQNFLKLREQLQCAFILIDSNILPQQIDIDFINWMGEMQIPFILIFTKSDKSKPATVENNIEQFKEKMLETWNTLPEYFVTSSNKKIGKTELLEFIGKINQSFKDHL